MIRIHQRTISLVCFLSTIVLTACSSDDTDPAGTDGNQDAGSEATPDAPQTETGSDAQPVPDCPSPHCEPDDDVEPPAAGNYRSWSFPTEVSVGAVALSENGRRIVVGDQAGKLRLFTHDGGGTPVWTFQAPDSQAQFNAVDISRDGLTVVATDGLTTIHLFECDAPEPMWSYDTGDLTDPFVDVAISHDGCTVAAASKTKVYVFENKSEEPVAIHEPAVSQGGWFTTVAIAGDGSRIAAGTWITDMTGAELFVFDGTEQVGTWQTDYVSQSSNAVPMPIAISRDGSTIAAGGADQQVHLLDGSVASTGTYAFGETEGSVWSLALSDDGTRLFASAGEDTAWLFRDTASSAPSWTYDGNFASPHASGVGLVDPYRGGNSPEGDYGIGAYPGTVAMSADGKYMAAGAWNSGNIFGMTETHDRPFRVYRATSDTDAINVVAMSADGSWIVAGTTFGEVLAWEVAPAVMIEMGTPATVSIPSNPEVTDTLDLDDVEFERTLVKPGRAANMTERWSLWALIGGVPVPPEASWLVSSGDFEQEHQRNLPDSNFDETTQESMPVPQIWQSGITAVTGFLLRVELQDEGTGTAASDEAAPFVDVQVGGN